MRNPLILPFDIPQLQPAYFFHHLLHLPIQLRLQRNHALFNLRPLLNLHGEFLELLVQSHQILQDFFVVVAVFFFLLFDFSEGGGCGVALLAAEVSLIVIDFHFGLNLVFEVAAEAVFDGVELLLADGLDSCGFGLGAQAEVVRVAGFMGGPHQTKDLDFLFGLAVFGLVFTLGHLGLQQSLLHPHQLHPQVLVLALQVLYQALELAVLLPLETTLAAVRSDYH